MIVYQEFTVPHYRGTHLCALVAGASWSEALERLRRDDPIWRGFAVFWRGMYEFPDHVYRCRPRTRPFICWFEPATFPGSQ